MEKLLTKRATIILVGALTLWRLYLSATLQLHPDEAYYWLWSRHLDVAYFDHPPLVAWFIWLTTRFSDAELWVRLSGTLVSLIVSGLMWQLAMQLFRSVRVAAGSVMLFNAYPWTVLGLMVMTPDVPVLLFWSLSVWLFGQLLGRRQPWLWYALGVSFGLALLAKYTALLLVPCLFIYLALTDERRWLKTRHPYLALLLGLLLFLPVVYWNSRHGWVSFEFQLRNGLGTEAYSLGHVAEFIGGQMLITGPVVWPLGLYAAWIGLYRRDPQARWLMATSMPVIAFFACTSYSSVAGPNWPAFAYFSFSVLVAKFCLDSSARLRRALWSIAFLTSLALSAVITLHARFNLIPPGLFSREQAAADATSWFYGWRELGAELKKYPGQAFVVTPSHQLSAEIIYYTGGSLPARPEPGARPSQFDLWPWPGNLRGRDGLYVWTEGESIGPYARYFASTRRGDSLRIQRHGSTVRTYHIVLGQGGLLPLSTGDALQPAQPAGALAAVQPARTDRR